MRHLIYAIAGLALLGLVVWAFLPRPIDVDLAAIAPRTIEVTVVEEGVARVREVFTVSAPAGGKLRRIDLHAGDPVFAQKTIVAVIDPAAPALLDARARSVAEATVAAARSAVDLARSQVAVAEASLEFKTAEADRSHALFERAAISQRLLDVAVLEQKNAEAALASARANLAVRERELEGTQAVLGPTDPAAVEACCVELIAPVSGRVLRVLTENEQVVLPGTPILEVGNAGNLEIAVDLLSRDAVRVQEGSEALITSWGGPPITARVQRVEPSATTRVSALGIDEQRVKVILNPHGNPNDWRLLGHGFRVVAHITLWKGQVMAIPVGALFRDGSDWATYVVEDGQAQLRVVTLGERNDTFAQVVSGVQGGEVVILHPSDRISEGIAVVPLAGLETK